MIQQNLYVLVVVDDVEPEVHGPFPSEEERDGFAAGYRRDNGPDHGIFALGVGPTGVPVVEAYSGAFFADE